MLKVLIVDDEQPVRQWFEYVINQCHQEFSIVGLASNGQEALQLYRLHKPDIVITDIIMPVMNGLELIQEIMKLQDPPQFLIVSNYDDFGYVRTGLVSGARDYLLKAEADDSDIIEILRKIKNDLISIAENKTQLVERESEIRSTLLKDFFNSGTIDHKVLEEINSQIKQSITSAELVILVVAVDYYEQVKQQNRELDVKRVLGQVLSNGMVVQCKENEFVIIAGLDEKDSINYKKAVADWFREINMELDAQMASTASCGASNPFHQMNGLKAKFFEAKHALENKFFSGQGSLHFSENLKINPEGAEQLNKAVRQLSINMDILDNGIINDLQAIFTLIEELPGLIPLEVKSGFNKILDKAFQKVAEEIESSELPSRFLVLEGLRQDEEFLVDFQHLMIQMINECTELAIRHTFIYSEATNKIVAYLYKNFDKKLEMKHLAMLVHLNENYISQLFKKETGSSLTKFLLSIRMDAAKNLLRNTRLKVNEVAARVGYQNEPHFSRDFKIYYGKSPKNFNKSN
jgi:two-component system response regulator YesN